MYEVILHDNITLQSLFKSFKWIFSCYPPHSLDVAPSDYQLFKDLKKFLKETCFQNNDKMKITVLNFIPNLDEKYFDEDLLK